MREVTLAAIQPPDQREGTTPSAQKASNVSVALRMMENAVEKGADLICLPETFQMTGLEKHADTMLELADEEGGELSQKLCSFARRNRTNIVAPVLGRYGDVLRNVAWVISREGDHLGRFFKVHLTGSEHELGIVPGDHWPVFELDFGHLGVMICHDNGFPESARCLALNDAEVVCWPHVQSGWGDVGWDITLRSRAIDNSVYVLSSCYGIPPERAWRPGMMMGRSGLVGPDGTILLDGGRTPGVYGTTVDLDKRLLKHDFTCAGDHDFRLSMLNTRRPETYTAMTKPVKTATTSLHL